MYRFMYRVNYQLYCLTKNGGINEETNVFACFGIFRDNELLH